jgi:hypothetical protein
MFSPFIAFVMDPVSFSFHTQLIPTPLLTCTIWLVVHDS